MMLVCLLFGMIVGSGVYAGKHLSLSYVLGQEEGVSSFCWVPTPPMLRLCEEKVISRDAIAQEPPPRRMTKHDLQSP